MCNVWNACTPILASVAFSVLKLKFGDISLSNHEYSPGGQRIEQNQLKIFMQVGVNSEC